MGLAPDILHDLVCLGCGCLCDDLIVKVDAGSLLEAVNACPLGLATLRDRLNRGPASPFDPAETASAIVRRLRSSRSPLILLHEVSTETASAAVGIADRARAFIERVAEPGPISFAFARDGGVSATLGEVKDRSDLVIYWMVDRERYPRHRERCAPGDRRVLSVGTPNPGDEVLHLPSNFGPLHTELFAVLRAVVARRPIDVGRAERSLGLPSGWIKNFVETLLSAKHGAIFLGDIPAIARAEAMRLVTDLNQGRRFVGLEMGDGTNTAGIDAALTWSTGSPRSVDFNQGVPRGAPGEGRRRLEPGRVDLVLSITSGDRPMGGDVTIAPGGGSGSIKVDVGRLGIDDGGTVSRVDGVMLPVRPIVASGRPSALEVCRAINARWDAEEISR